MGLLPANQPVVRSYADNMRVILYGPAMIGKTTFASTFPDALFINTDGNIKGIDNPAISLSYTFNPANHYTENHANGWPLFRKLIPELLATEEYKTIVIDLVSELYEMCRRYVLDGMGVKSEQEVPHGKAYVEIREEFLSTMATLMNSGKNVVLICHTKSVKDKQGNITAKTSDLPEKIFLGLVKNSCAHLYMETWKDEYGREVLDEAGNKTRILRMSDESLSSANRWSITGLMPADYTMLRSEIEKQERQ